MESLVSKLTTSFSAVYVNQTSMNVKLSKKLGGPSRGQPKIYGAMAHPGPP